MPTRRQFELNALGKRLEKNEATSEDIYYLACCCKAMSEGADPRDVFKTRLSQGTTQKRLNAALIKNMAISQIPAFMRPAYQSESDYSQNIPSGEGLTEIEAIKRVADLFSIEIETMERYWNEYKRECKKNHRDPYSRSFPLITLYPK